MKNKIHKSPATPMLFFIITPAPNMVLKTLEIACPAPGIKETPLCTTLPFIESMAGNNKLCNTCTPAIAVNILFNTQSIPF